MSQNGGGWEEKPRGGFAGKQRGASSSARARGLLLMSESQKASRLLTGFACLGYIECDATVASGRNRYPMLPLAGFASLLEQRTR